jgi:hypothetical protein
MTNTPKDFHRIIKRRIDWVSIHWNSAMENYHDIDNFIIHINSCIQELRNLTFILQKHKKLYSSFDEWYEPKRLEMKRDDNLKWLHDSRNKVVKEEDLKINSIAYLSINNWIEHKVSKLKLDPFLSNDELIFLFIKLSWEEKLKNISSNLEAPLLEIERVWIDADYKEIEILSLLRHWYNYFISIISEYLDLIWEQLLNVDNIDFKELEIKKKILIDMKAWHIINMTRIQFNKDEIPEEVQSKAKEIFDKIKENYTWDLVLDKMNWHLDMAKQIILNWEQHLPMCFYYWDDFNLMNFVPWLFEDRTWKYAWIRWLAREIENNKSITSIILIDEAWTVDMKDWEEHIKQPYPWKAKGEALCITFFNKDLFIKELVLNFERKGKRVFFWDVIIEEPEIDKIMKLNPIMEVWSK